MTTPAMAANQLARDHAAATSTLVVSEVFGPTIQGEGPSMGRRAAFVRLGGCNLHCSWCDTGYTWDATRYDLRNELHRRPVRDILAQLRQYQVPLVVITGGEPLLHQRQPGWAHLLHGIALTGMQVEVETNGTHTPSAWTRRHVTRFNVSPKLAHAGDPEHARIVPDALHRYADLAAQGRAVFKFVCQTTTDLAQVTRLVHDHHLPPSSVWVMPEGTTPDQVLATGRELADPAIALGYNITTRLHTLLWGSERAK